MVLKGKTVNTDGSPRSRDYPMIGKFFITRDPSSAHGIRKKHDISGFMVQGYCAVRCCDVALVIGDKAWAFVPRRLLLCILTNIIHKMLDEIVCSS